MSIQSDIGTALAGIAGGKVWPEAAELDDDGKVVPPFCVYVRTSCAPLQTLLGSNGDINSEFVFECYGTRKTEAMALADQVRAAIVAARTTILKVQYEMPVTTESYTPEVMEYMEPVGFGFWHT